MMITMIITQAGKFKLKEKILMGAKEEKVRIIKNYPKIKLTKK